MKPFTQLTKTLNLIIRLNWFDNLFNMCCQKWQGKWLQISWQTWGSHSGKKKFWVVLHTGHKGRCSVRRRKEATRKKTQNWRGEREPLRRRQNQILFSQGRFDEEVEENHLRRRGCQFMLGQENYKRNLMWPGAAPFKILVFLFKYVFSFVAKAGPQKRVQSFSPSKIFASKSDEWKKKEEKRAFQRISCLWRPGYIIFKFIIFFYI